MGSLFDIGKLLSSPELIRALVRVETYPPSVVVVEKDSWGKAEEKITSLEVYIWNILGVGRDFEAIDWTRNPDEIVFLLKQGKEAIENLEKTLKKGGIAIEVISTSPVQGRFGFYRF